MNIIDGTRTFVKKVQGKTRFSNNLIDLSAFNGKTFSGVAVTVNDYEISFNGTATAGGGGGAAYFENLEVGKTYCLRQSKSFTGSDYKIGFNLYSPSTTVEGASDFLGNTSDGEAHTFVYASGMFCTINIDTSTNLPVINETFKVMLNEGETPLDFERTDVVVNSIFSGIASQNSDGTEIDSFAIADPIELGAFDYIDTEKQQVVRQTYYIDCATTPFDIGCSYSDGYKAYIFWLAFLTAPKVYQGAYKATDIVPNHYEVGGSTKDKRVIFGRTAQDTLCITIRDDEFVRYNDDGSFSQALSSKALKAHLVEIGFQFACKPSEVLETDDIVCPKSYIAYNGGTELIEYQGEIVTVTQDYYEIVGGAE